MSEEEKYRDLLNGGDSSFEDELTQYLKNAESAKIPVGKGKKEIWDKIEERIPEGKSRSFRPWAFIAVAAAVALVVTFSLVFQSSETVRISTEIGQSLIHTLPDGSTVTLNANSLVSYSGDWNRELKLTGEAFFEVEKGERFVVKTDVGNVEVLGTSFNVFARGNDLEVACKTGKIKVSVPAISYDENIIPGEMISFKKDTVRKTIQKPELMGSWQTGIFYFNESTFSEVLEELKRQFRIQVEFQKANEMEFDGYFTNKNLDQALQMICLPLGLEYEKVSASSIVITETSD
ncbi:MAG: FecR domain-containing protein [Bacteroidota bacterium]